LPRNSQVPPGMPDEKKRTTFSRKDLLSEGAAQEVLLEIPSGDLPGKKSPPQTARFPPGNNPFGGKIKKKGINVKKLSLL